MQKAGLENLKSADYRLIAADIDGTLVPFGGKMREKSTKTIRSLSEEGYIFVLATGRPYAGVKDIIKGCALFSNPVIVYNGAEIYVGENRVYSCVLPVSVSEKICAEGRKVNAEVICWADGKLYAEKESSFLTEYVSISKVAPIIVKDVSSLAKCGVTKYLYMVEEDRVKPLTEKMRFALPSVNVYSSRKRLIEFVPKECSKAEALKKVCKIVGVDKSRTVAIGDGENDIDMLKFAALSIAPENASDEVKREADIVCKSVDDDGVGKFLREFLRS